MHRKHNYSSKYTLKIITKTLKIVWKESINFLNFYKGMEKFSGVENYLIQLFAEEKKELFDPIE